MEYYVSYYDYYQPEAYIPSTGTYIEKDLAINEDLDRRRLAATSALLSGRKDVIIISSVSCIYGMGAPTSYAENILAIQVDQDLPQEVLRDSAEHRWHQSRACSSEKPKECRNARRPRGHISSRFSA